MPDQATVRSVDDDGILAEGGSGEDVVVDVLFDGRRVWSFWLQRDSEPPRTAAPRVAWPAAAQVPRRAHAARPCASTSAARCYFDEELPSAPARSGSGSSTARGAARHRQVRPAGADLRDPQRRADVAPLLDAIEAVLEALHDGRRRAVPGLRHPARRGPRGQAARPRLRRRPRLRQPPHRPGRRRPRVVPARSAGSPSWASRIYRYSGAAFKVRRRSRATASSAGSTSSAASSTRRPALPDGRDRRPVRAGLDLPARTSDARGPDASRRRRDPERLLEATYGPCWRVPGPGVQVHDAAATARRARRLVPRHRVGRGDWERHGSGRRRGEPPPRPSRGARLGAAPAARTIGAGARRRLRRAAPTACWLAAQGDAGDAGSTTPAARCRHLERARRSAEEVPLEFATARTSPSGARCSAGAPGWRAGRGPRVVLARHVVDATRPGRARRPAGGCARWLRPRAAAGSTSRSSSAADAATPGRPAPMLRPLDPDRVVGELEGAAPRSRRWTGWSLPARRPDERADRHPRTTDLPNGGRVDKLSLTSPVAAPGAGRRHDGWSSGSPTSRPTCASAAGTTCGSPSSPTSSRSCCVPMASRDEDAHPGGHRAHSTSSRLA